MPAPKGKPPKGILNGPPVLGVPDSATLRGRLLAQLTDTDDLLTWAKISLPLKNSLQETDARLVEAAYEKRLELAAANAEEARPEPNYAEGSASEAKSQPVATRPGKAQPAQAGDGR